MGRGHDPVLLSQPGANPPIIGRLINKLDEYPLGVPEDRQVYGRRRFVGNRGT